MTYYLRFQNDYLEDAVGYRSKTAALEVFRDTAAELSRYDQQVEATIHIAPRRAEIAEYPDFVLSLGPRGGVRCEAA